MLMISIYVKGQRWAPDTRPRSLEFITCHRPRISVTSYAFTRHLKTFYIQSAVSLPHFSCPPCPVYLCLQALTLLRLWRYINHVHVLTYTRSRNRFQKLAP